MSTTMHKNMSHIWRVENEITVKQTQISRHSQLLRAESPMLVLEPKECLGVKKIAGQDAAFKSSL